MKLKQGGLGLTLVVMMPACFAAIPASTQYVDAQFNAVKAQIAAITPGVAHPVGSCYGGGVVFYVNSNANAPVGQRGLIVAPSDANGTTTGTDALITGCTAGNPVTCVWDNSNTTGSNGTLVTGTSSLYFTGVANTTAITGTTNIPSGWPAAQAAEAYNTYNPPSTIPGCTGTMCNWALPSEDELATLYFQSTNINSFGSTCMPTYTAPNAAYNYWSSTQDGAYLAWVVYFLAGSVGNSTTGDALPVRAVRAF